MVLVRAHLGRARGSKVLRRRIVAHVLWWRFSPRAVLSLLVWSAVGLVGVLRALVEGEVVLGNAVLPVAAALAI